eukprot:4500664-Prymnesium_polylepis.1
MIPAPAHGVVPVQGRELQSVTQYVSTVEELTAAVADSSVARIVVGAGTYLFASSMCSSSALCIDRDVLIEAATPGTAVLNAGSRGPHGTWSWSSALAYRRVLHISAGAVVLTGLNITGGYADPGGGIRIDGGQATFSGCSIYSNTADYRGAGYGAQGGGLYVRGSGTVVTLTGCSVYQNFAYGTGGGGVRIDGGQVTFSGCSIYSNTAVSAQGPNIHISHYACLLYTSPSPRDAHES